MTLTDFLLARIAEDEATARSAREEYSAPIYYLYDHADLDTYCDTDYAEAMIRVGPARVLGECEAKRELLRLADPYDFADDGGTGMSEHADEIRRILAHPYADHPDFRPEWRV